MMIGDVELPIVSDIEEQEQAEVSEIKDGFKHIDSVTVQHKPSIQTIIISGFVNEELYSSNKTISEQKSDIKSLRQLNIEDNTIDYRDYKGHLLIENINFGDNPDSKIINDVEIEARYFPWPKYYPENEP